MKIVCTVFWISFFYGVAYGQDSVNNFQVLQEEIVWQKVFQTKLSFEALAERVKDSGLLDKIELSQNKVSGELKALDADFKGAGFAEMAAPMYIARSHFTGYAVLEYKEGRYRVTLHKILLTQRYSDPLSNQGETNHLEYYALNSKKEINKAFQKTSGLILDYTFSKKFDFNAVQPNKEW